VRSESAPNNGFASAATAAPTPVTTPNTSSLLLGATCSACSASRTWIGPKKAANIPTVASVRPATQIRATGSTGGASSEESSGADMAGA